MDTTQRSNHPIHPAIHFDADAAFVGVFNEKRELELIGRRPVGTPFRLKTAKDTNGKELHIIVPSPLIHIEPNRPIEPAAKFFPLLRRRWAAEDINAFLLD